MTLATRRPSGPPSTSRFDAGIGWLVIRFRRHALRRVPPPLAVLIVLCWAFSGALAWLLLLPGFADAVMKSPIGFPTPAWFMSGLLICAAALAASWTAVLLDAPRRSRPVGTAIVRIGFPATLPMLALAADREWVALSIAAVSAAGAIALGLAPREPATREHGTRAGRDRAVGTRVGAARVALGAFLSAVPWVIAAWFELRAPFIGFAGWIWIELMPLATGAAAFIGFYALVSVTRSRQTRLPWIARTDHSPWVVAIVFLIAAGIIAARITFANGFFNETEAMTWVIRRNWSWLHAALVAAAIAVLALRPAPGPLAAEDTRVSMTGIRLAGSWSLLVWSAVGVTGVISLLITAQPFVWDGFVDVDAWVSLIVVLALAAIVMLPRFRRTVDRPIALISAFYLVPILTVIAVGVGDDPALVPFWATAQQVVVLLVGIGGALALVNLMTRRRVVPSSVILRMIVVPIIAVHAGEALPFFLSKPLGLATVAIGLVVTVFVAAPKVSSDPHTHGRALLTLASAQLAAALLATLGTASLLGGDVATVLATQWLTVPIVVATLLVRRRRMTSESSIILV
ncbi:hypothetical protein [Naasia lichenicola]|uniref:Uncharacterized protein n=1 Tax=Naasia lichenicola TaxID=2565933 RepID=A0A4S4FK34_9MICO|nr:hypothetical protein [Naasia lichenicola]THG30783.1 hypothetical protein E6C64_09090 [Naasia lichenicola]THG32020.1 hypothetical protein E6C64_08235 [Naasia lichenicola]